MNPLQLITMSIFGIPIFIILMCPLIGIIKHINSHWKLKVGTDAFLSTAFLICLLNFNSLVYKYVQAENNINIYLAQFRPDKEPVNSPNIINQKENI